MTSPNVNLPAPTSLAPRPREVEYLLPLEQSFWQWSPDGKAIEWRDGRTIAFRPEVLAVLRQLAPTGLPPFGAIVLLLAATRDNWNAIAEKSKPILAGYCALVGSADPQALVSIAVPPRVRQELADVLGDLEAVASLAEEVRAKPHAKAALAQLVFDMLPRQLGLDAAREVIALFDSGIDPESLRRSARRDDQFTSFLEDLDALRQGLGRVAPEPLSQFMQTGVDRGVEPADINVPPVQRVRGLLRELRDDPELSGLARLAQDLLAAIHIPRVLVAPEDLPVGGVSDIANRGPLDRLLLSELAHDELTLAVRVALGEALYLRRESPAQHPPIGRVVLIDCGIRMWGVPRLFATAVALALVASSDPKAPVEVYRSKLRDVDTADLMSRDGVTKQLAALDPLPQPGTSVRAVLELAASSRGMGGLAHAPAAPAAQENAARARPPVPPGNGSRECEIFIVTHESVLDDAAFTRDLRAADPDRDWHVATVTADGAFTLWLLAGSGRRELCRAKLSLDEVLAEPKPKRPATPPIVVRDPALPAIFSLRPFPLLLPAQIEPRLSAGSATLGLIAVTHDRRLMRWTSPDRGGEELATALPPGRIERLFADDERAVAHVIATRGEARKLHVLTVNLDTLDLRTRAFAGERPLIVLYRHGLIAFVYRRVVRMLSSDGGAMQEIAIPDGMVWNNGRFFRSRGAWFALTHAGFEHVTNRPGVAMWDRAGLGPWLLRGDGSVMPADGEAQIPSTPQRFGWAFVAASADGSRIAARQHEGQPGRQENFVMDLANDPHSWTRVGTNDDSAYAQLTGDMIRWPHGAGIHLRRRFSTISTSPDNWPALRTGGWPAVVMPSGTGVLVWRALRESWHRFGPGARFAPFRGRRVGDADAAPRWPLHVATLPKGGRAFLDGRGLLHVIPSDAGLPQVTLTVCARPDPTFDYSSVAGWRSDGQTFGESYFLRERQGPTMAMSDAVQLIRRIAGEIS